MNIHQNERNPKGLKLVQPMLLLSFTMRFFTNMRKKIFRAYGKQNILFYVIYLLLKRRLILADYNNNYKELLFQYELLFQSFKTAFGKENPYFILEKKASLQKYSWKISRGGRKASLRDQATLRRHLTSHPHVNVNC